jgi:membrane-bound ClpP family serine protease
MNFRNIFWGVILIITGSLFLVEELTDFDFGRFFWPIILIVTGGLLLVRNFLNSDNANRSNI